MYVRLHFSFCYCSYEIQFMQTLKSSSVSEDSYKRHSELIQQIYHLCYNVKKKRFNTKYALSWSGSLGMWDKWLNYVVF